LPLKRHQGAQKTTHNNCSKNTVNYAKNYVKMGNVSPYHRGDNIFRYTPTRRLHTEVCCQYSAGVQHHQQYPWLFAVVIDCRYGTSFSVRRRTRTRTACGYNLFCDIPWFYTKKISNCRGI